MEQKNGTLYTVQGRDMLLLPGVIRPNTYRPETYENGQKSSVSGRWLLHVYMYIRHITHNMEKMGYSAHNRSRVKVMCIIHMVKSLKFQYHACIPLLYSIIFVKHK